MGDVVGAVREAVDLVVAGTLSEHQRVGESGSAGADVHGGTTGEIETAHDKGPAVGVPGPVGNRVVDDGGPDKDEDDGREHAATVSSGTDSEGRTGNQVSKIWTWRVTKKDTNVIAANMPW